MAKVSLIHVTTVPASLLAFFRGQIDESRLVQNDIAQFAGIRRAQDRLAAIGRWMQLNGRSVYGATQAPPEFAAPPSTLRGTTVNAAAAAAPPRKFLRVTF